jgi:2-polyprenyl-3-methyl-5-hydroxy-6-metoxy-1,4-benzoquinol methylase
MNVQSTQERAQFVSRDRCISCGSDRIALISTGRYTEEPLKSLMEADPYGESPMPFLQEASWRFVGCADCSQMFHQLILAPEWNDRYHSKWMSADAIIEFERRMAAQEGRAFIRGRTLTEHVLRLERMTRGIRKSEPVRLLDFGCGWGEFLAVANHFGFRCFGIDAAPPRREGGQVSIFPNLQRLAENTRENFHAITLFEVLEHLPDPLSVLKSLAGLMRPNGILVLETPNCTGVMGIRNPHEYMQIGPLGHINAFTPTSLSAIARRSGFERVHKVAANVTTDWIRLAKNEVGALVKPLNTQQYFRYVGESR